ncbi:NAD(P)H-dependent oxidoreductase subunit E [bacterium]|nr:NAD(P)H-dependent oxidoreductase subunit E [bacterium]
MDTDSKTSELNLDELDDIVEKIGHSKEHVIPILQAIQNRYNYLPQGMLHRVCEITDITPADIVGISTFYSQFRHVPVGKHIIRICTGTACHVKGADRVYDAFMRHLHIAENQDTDPDGLFTLEKVACLGCCTIAPVIQISGVTYGHLTPDGVSDVIKDFLEQEQTGQQPLKKGKKQVDEQLGEMRIGLGSCCVASGSAKIHQTLLDSLAQSNVNVKVKRVGCVGMCHQVPLLEVNMPGQPVAHYSHLQQETIQKIIDKHIKPKQFRKRIQNTVSRWLDNLLTDETWQSAAKYAIDFRDPPVAAFLDQQKHIATEHYGTLDPLDMDEYKKGDGFKALEDCLHRSSPEKIIASIRQSGLRGRGGGGFPTGQKWERVHKSSGSQKYIICNGDEGDPGAFMDRMLLESYPFRIIEGMAIAAFAVGASEGVFYIRAEYPLALQRIREALRQCREFGLLGENILGSGFSLNLRIMEGAGAFVCGEETALIASIEGKRGMPRIRPPYPAEAGLWGAPTLVNNVETYAQVSWIMRNGPDAFAQIGTKKSKGTKVFALAGKIARGGLIEVPMGMTIREIVNDIGGGIAGGKQFKAIQIGGPSGGCIPAHLADTPIDFEALLDVGAMMGSGGLVVLDESDCMVDIARYFLSFTQAQSCGKCTFCRVGTRRMLDILDRLCTGHGQKDDVDKLEHLAHKVRQGSLCGLGRTAPNPVLTTIKYFRDEYEAHIEGKCPAKKCTSLITYTINDNCIGCTKCAQHCPVGAIPMTPYEKHVIDNEKCTRCDTCRKICEFDAVDIES